MRKLIICLVAGLLVLVIGLGAEMVPMEQDRTPVYQHRQASDAQYCGSEEESARQVNGDGSLSDGSFCSHLPVVCLETGGQELSQEAEALASLSVIDCQGGHNHLDKEPAFTTDTLIKIRGNSSSRFDKKQYRLTFVESKTDLTHRSISVMGMKKDAEWVLNGPFLDKTAMRNYLMYHLAGEIMDWAPNVRYCEVFLDGKYQGLYLMIESVKVDKNRVNVTEVMDGSVSTGYMVSRERLGDTAFALHNFGTYSGKTMNELGMAYPGTKTRTEEYAEYVRQDIGKFEKALYSLDYDTPGKSYEEYIDVQSFIDYFLLNEFSLNVDGGGLSTYAHKDIRGKLVMGPVWDFNNSFDNYEYYTLRMDEFYVVEKSWYVMLFRDEDFVEETIARYHLLRQGILSDENIFSILDETREFLGPAIARNDAVWGYSYDDGWLDNFDMQLKPLSYDRNPEDYEDAVGQLKQVISERGAFLDEYIRVLRQFSAESAVKEWN